MKEEKERKTGREEGRERKERQAERDRRRRPQNEWTSHPRTCHLSTAAQSLNLSVGSERSLPIDTGMTI